MTIYSQFVGALLFLGVIMNRYFFQTFLLIFLTISQTELDAMKRRHDGDEQGHSKKAHVDNSPESQAIVALMTAAADQKAQCLASMIDVTDHNTVINSLEFIFRCCQLDTYFNSVATDQNLAVCLNHTLTSRKGMSVLTFVNNNQETLLHAVARNLNAHQRVLTILLNAVGGNCLQFASKANNQQETAMHTAVKSGNILFIQWLCNAAGQAAQHLVLLKDAFSNTPLHLAAYAGHANIVTTLLNIPGINHHQLASMPNQFGWNLLHLAASQGQNPTHVISALAAEPRINMNLLATQGDTHGWTCIHLAATLGNGAVLQALSSIPGLSIKNVIQQRDRKGCTPLHIASKQGHYQFVSSLIALMGDNAQSLILMRDFDGNHAFGIALALGFEDIAYFLNALI